MFTGIVETMGRLVKSEQDGTNIDLWFETTMAEELKIDQSVAHNGVCLTVVEIHANQYRVTVIEESLKRTNLGDLTQGAQVNLERCMPANGRFDGHVVQGHVDETATVSKIEQRDGSWNFFFKLNQAHEGLIVPKGSITINGTSLTVVNVEEDAFSVSIIPYTYENTVFHALQIKDRVNIEFDILGKYVAATMKHYATQLS